MRMAIKEFDSERFVMEKASSDGAEGPNPKLFLLQAQARHLETCLQCGWKRVLGHTFAGKESRHQPANGFIEDLLYKLHEVQGRHGCGFAEQIW